MKHLLLEPVIAALVAGTLLLPITMPNGSRAENSPANSAQFESLQIDGLNIAYSEAGDPETPTILLLHGFPTSSHMFCDLIPASGESYHVIVVLSDWLVRQPNKSLAPLS